MADGLRSLARAFTKEPPAPSVGVVTIHGQEAAALVNPGTPRYVTRPDGLFWQVDHAGGTFEVLASLRLGYQLRTADGDSLLQQLQGGFY